jgi:hypothetical protein
MPTVHWPRATNVTLAIAHGAAIEHVSRDVGAEVRTTRRYLEPKRQRENNSALVLPVEF